MNDTPTPETDEFCSHMHNMTRLPDFARKLERERDELRQRSELLLQIRERDKVKVESDSIVASCECNVKTNDPQHHAKGCKYRLICERDMARGARHLSHFPPLQSNMEDASYQRHHC